MNSKNNIVRTMPIHMCARLNWSTFSHCCVTNPNRTKKPLRNPRIDYNPIVHKNEMPRYKKMDIRQYYKSHRVTIKFWRLVSWCVVNCNEDDMSEHYHHVHWRPSLISNHHYEKSLKDHTLNNETFGPVTRSSRVMTESMVHCKRQTTLSKTHWLSQLNTIFFSVYSFSGVSSSAPSNM